MQSTMRKMGLLILMVIILPILIFSVFEIGNLRQNEKVIQDIYKNQLDAILFSINQYSDDIISNLASRIENSSNLDAAGTGSELGKLISEIPSVAGLIQFSISFAYMSSVPESCCDKELLSEMIARLDSSKKPLKKLQTYLRGGYRKIERLGKAHRGMQWIVFMTRAKDHDIINVLVIDPGKFISHLLDPKIQEIAKGKFNIVAYQAGRELPFYTSDKQYNPANINDKEPFWLLQDYRMGIELKDVTIADLARDRVRSSLMLIGFMDIILLLGAWLIYRNVKKQVELSQLKSDFVSGVSHEIRTPLALISMYIETLEMGRVNSAEKIREYYAVILNETSRLSGIVNRILNFSQIESNKRKYNFTEINLNEVVENATPTFRHSMENKGFTYSYEPEANLPSVLADKEALADAFINLIDNAMKYSPVNKNLTVRTGKQDHFVYVEVEDQGIGISEKNQKYIFDRFYRVTETNLAYKVKGSGLGLAIVKHIVDAHKGMIIVKSTPGSGSLFRLLFPVT
jgi:two-component system, OmpR family, phosphate regulon sensor histidine kinase PhoR